MSETTVIAKSELQESIDSKESGIQFERLYVIRQQLDILELYHSEMCIRLDAKALKSGSEYHSVDYLHMVSGALNDAINWASKMTK